MNLRVLVVLVLALGSPAAHAQDKAVIFILDGSNSMWGRIDGVEKIVVARDVLSEMLSELPTDLQVGLAAYGHRTTDSCDDIETILPVGQHSKEDVEKAVNRITPRGRTPLTAALEHVVKALEDRPGQAQIVLVSDGLETCDRDPCEFVRSLRNPNLSLAVHVVGFDVDSEEREQLQCIADAGGGIYAGAGSADELTAALGDIRQTVVEGAIPPVGDSRGYYWRLESEGQVYEGRLFKHFLLSGNPMIQLINPDAVNFAMVFEGDMSGERTVTEATFAHGRGPVCQRVGPLDMFTIKFEPAGPGWVSGSFAGMLGCPDYSAMPVEGSFRIKAPGE